jgi:hypothetical protein
MNRGVSQFLHYINGVKKLNIYIKTKKKQTL